MAKKPKKDKSIKVHEHFQCPHCKKKVELKVKEDIIEPAVKAIKQRKVIVEKDSQQTLQDTHETKLPIIKGGVSADEALGVEQVTSTRAR